MGRALIPDEDTATVRGLPLGLARHEAVDATGQHREVLFLTGDHVRQILDRAGQVCDLFLKAYDIVHDPQIAPEAREINPRSRAVVALARGPR